MEINPNALPSANHAYITYLNSFRQRCYLNLSGTSLRFSLLIYKLVIEFLEYNIHV